MSIIQTSSGKKFDLINVDIDKIDIVDIANSLSKQCRFNGHIKEFYSVAQHCCHVSDLLPAQYRLDGLLHDAAEAYVTDLPSPIKHMDGMDFFVEIEDNIERAIFEKYSVEYTLPTTVKRADGIMLATEARDLLGSPNDESWNWTKEYPEPVKWNIKSWSIERSKLEFLYRFESLIGDKGE